jgi:UDP-glucose 4-epimerase
MFSDKTLLITGGTGSFGKTITEYLLDYNLKEIRVFSRDEKKQEDMRLSLKNNKLKFIIGDVRDYNSIYDASKNV